MRILLVHPGPDFSVADVHDGLQAGLVAAGHEVGVLNLNDRLNFYVGAYIQRDGEMLQAFEYNAAMRLAAKGIETMCYEFWPEVIVVISGFFVPPEVWAVLSRRPHHKVLWCTESPYEDDKQAQPASFADTVILNDPTNIESMRDVNPRTFYLPQSYDPRRHYPPCEPPSAMCDFAFVGTGFPSRIEFFEQVDWTGIDARFSGNWQSLKEDSPLAPLLTHPGAVCMDNAATAEVYRRSRVTANLYRKETTDGGTADGWAIGPREVELAACGTFFLREPRAEGDALFPELPTFTTPAEFESSLRYWLAHPVERAEIAARSRAAIQHRTFDRTAAQLLSLIDGAPTTIR